MNELEELEEMMRDLMAGVQDVLMSGEKLDDEFQGMIAQTLGSLMDKIDELRIQQQERKEEELQAKGAEPSDQIKLLWVLSGQNDQAFTSYLRSYPSEETRRLLENPSELSRVIEWLQATNPSSPKVPIDGIPHSPLNSSNVWGFKYDPKSRQMLVRFQGGSEYSYQGIPPQIFSLFSKGNAYARTKGKNRYGEWWVNKNPSLGAALNQYIKEGGFPYQRLK